MKRSADSQDVTLAKLLLVDDDPILLRAMVRILQAHEVRACSSGREALETLVAGHDFDAILLDFDMPGLDGGEVLAAIAAMRSPLAGACAFVTGSAELARAVRPDVPLLAKPFQPNELRELVARLVSPVVQRRAAATG